MSASKRVVVLGASGNLGYLIARAVGSRGAQLVTIVRGKSANSDRITELKQKYNAEIIEGDVNEENMHKAFKGAYAVVSALQGGAEIINQLQSKILEVAKQENVKRFIPSSFSINLFTLNDGDHVNLDIRRDFARYAEANRGSVEIVHVLCGVFLDVDVLFRFLGFFDLKSNQALYVYSFF